MARSGIGFAVPVRDGMEERWRRFLQELGSIRREDYENLRRRMGISRQFVWLLRVRRTDLAIVYVECTEPETIIARLAASTEPFDLWFKDRLTEFHDCDLTRPDPRWSPELIFDSAGYHAPAHGVTTASRHRDTNDESNDADNRHATNSDADSRSTPDALPTNETRNP